MNIRNIALLTFIVLSQFAMSQSVNNLNRTDKEGRKQGHWIKYYPNGNILYDGIFVNDQPSGEFKRYYEDKALKSVLVFTENGTEAQARLYYPNGFIASEGKYSNHLKEGKWQFFSPTNEDLLIREEEYSRDKKEGISVVYYPDRKVAEKINYKSGLRHGEYLKFYPDGTLMLRTSYTKGMADGKFEAFFENGKPEMTGEYRNNLREGQWIIYRKDGRQRFITRYSAGIPDNQDIDIYQSNYIDSLEKNKVKIPDPEKTGEIW